MKSLMFILITSLVIASSTVFAGKGPKGRPAFMDYEWTEVVPTDFLTPERWEPRAGLQAVELHNHLFVIAGRTPSPTIDNPFASIIHGDVWVSPDFDTNPSDIWVSKDGADWVQVSDSPWNNDPSYSDCIFADPPQLPIACDNVRYDFDMLTVSGGKRGMKPSIFTFGGDREIFAPIPGNEFRIENDVWRYSPKR